MVAVEKTTHVYILSFDEIDATYPSVNGFDLRGEVAWKRLDAENGEERVEFTALTERAKNWFDNFHFHLELYGGI